MTNLAEPSDTGNVLTVVPTGCSTEYAILLSGQFKVQQSPRIAALRFWGARVNHTEVGAMMSKSQ